MKQGEAQEEPNSTKSDIDATGNTLEGQTGKNMENRRNAFYLDDEEVNSTPERRSSDDAQEEKAHGKRRGPYRNSESGQKASDNHEDESRDKIAQKILRRRKGRNDTNTNYRFHLLDWTQPRTLCL